MYIKKTNKPKKIIIFAAIAVTLSTGYAFAAQQYSLWPVKNSSETNLSPATKDEKDTGSQIKKSSVDKNTASNTKVSGSDQPLSPIKDSSGSLTLLVDITAATQDESTVHIRTLIQAVLSNGQCNLTLTNTGTQPYSAISQIQALPTSSTCKGFDIPTSSLKPGKWMATIEITGDNINGQATKEFDIK